jgi:hypothetical protein
MSATRVLLAADQLGRAVPGGIGTVTSGLLGGLDALALRGPDGLDLAVWISRPPRHRAAKSRAGAAG